MLMKNQVEIIENGSVVFNEAGTIVAIGPADVVNAQYMETMFDLDLDCTGKSVVPGSLE
jgi:imidazolonepropionase-like amidohydrolase